MNYLNKKYTTAYNFCVAKYENCDTSRKYKYINIFIYKNLFKNKILQNVLENID
jgi:hypothetical protein